MTIPSEAANEAEFRSRVIPLLFSALMRHDAEAQRRGWFFEAIDQHQNGYRIPGAPGQPMIQWSLVASSSVQVAATPGALTVVSLPAFDRALAEEVVDAWWAAVTA